MLQLRVRLNGISFVTLLLRYFLVWKSVKVASEHSSKIYLHVITGECSDAIDASGGTFGRHVAPVEPPGDERHGHAHRLAHQHQALSRVQSHVRRRRGSLHVNRS